MTVCILYLPHILWIKRLSALCSASRSKNCTTYWTYSVTLQYRQNSLLYYRFSLLLNHCNAVAEWYKPISENMMCYFLCNITSFLLEKNALWFFIADFKMAATPRTEDRTWFLLYWASQIFNFFSFTEIKFRCPKAFGSSYPHVKSFTIFSI